MSQPRKKFFGGRSEKAKRFRLSFNPKSDKVTFDFENGAKLAIELWRICESLDFLRKHKVVEIGGRISENYSSYSLEGHLKELTKFKYGRATDTKTAPHITDLLVLVGIAELDFIKSSIGRAVQGLRLIQ